MFCQGVIDKKKKKIKCPTQERLVSAIFFCYPSRKIENYQRVHMLTKNETENGDLHEI